jgi:hypothetical protein
MSSKCCVVDGIIKHGFPTAGLITYSVKYLTAYSYAFKKNIEGKVCRLL